LKEVTCLFGRLNREFFPVLRLGRYLETSSLLFLGVTQSGFLMLFLNTHSFFGLSFGMLFPPRKG
jgi:hypothetical protein